MADQSDDSVARFERFMEALNCGAVITDRQGKLRHVNARACEMLGYDRDDLIGTNVLSLQKTDDSRRNIANVLDHFDQAHESEVELRHRDGSGVPVLASGRPLANGTARPEFRLATFLDISALKDAERVLAQQRDEMTKLNDTVIEQALALKRHSRQLEQRVRRRTEQLREANMDAIYMLAVASEAKDADTGQHVRRIEKYIRVLAQAAGEKESDAERLGHSAILHDVGKLYVPDNILQKPGPLTDDERAKMQQHTIVGEQILSTKPFFDVARQIARSHHENWDGSGYPDGLSGKSIPRAARMVRIADVFDALTHQRVYKDAWSGRLAVDAIEKQAARSFDPQLVGVFLGVIKDGAFEVESN